MNSAIFVRRTDVLAAVAACTLWLAGCASPGPQAVDDATDVPPEAAENVEQTTPSAGVAASPWALVSGARGEAAVSAWRHYAFPGKRPSLYRYVHIDGRDAVEVEARSSASMLRQTVRIEPDRLRHLRFSWKVPALIAEADLTVRERADSPVRIVLAFEGDRSTFSVKDAMLSELAQVLTGEPMPYATLMYVWANTSAPETVLHNPRTGRIRKIVTESGSGKLRQWLDYDRDIRADFIKAFGEPPGALVGIGVMTDTDNTRSRAQAWYGPIQHVASPP